MEQQSPVAQPHDSRDSSGDYKRPVTANETISCYFYIVIITCAHIKSNINTFAHLDPSCDLSLASKTNGRTSVFVVLFVCSLLKRLKTLGFYSLAPEPHEPPPIKCARRTETARKSSRQLKAN